MIMGKKKVYQFFMAVIGYCVMLDVGFKNNKLTSVFSGFQLHIVFLPETMKQGNLFCTVLKHEFIFSGKRFRLRCTKFWILVCKSWEIFSCRVLGESF